MRRQTGNSKWRATEGRGDRRSRGNGVNSGIGTGARRRVRSRGGRRRHARNPQLKYHPAAKYFFVMKHGVCHHLKRTRVGWMTSAKRGAIAQSRLIKQQTLGGGGRM